MQKPTDQDNRRVSARVDAMKRRMLNMREVLGMGHPSTILVDEKPPAVRSGSGKHHSALVADKD